MGFWSDVLYHWRARGYITILGCARYRVNFLYTLRDQTSLRLDIFFFRNGRLLIKTRVCSTICIFADNAALFRVDCSVSKLYKSLGYVRAWWLLNPDVPRIVTTFAFAAGITEQDVVIPHAIFCSIFFKFVDNI